MLLAPPSADDPGAIRQLQPWGKTLSLNPTAAARGEASGPLLVSRALLALRRLCCCHAAAAAASLPDLDLESEANGALATGFEVCGRLCVVAQLYWRRVVMRLESPENR